MNHESRLPLTIIKVGGSLFHLPDLPARLEILLSRAGRKVLLFGGGEDVDVLRQRTTVGDLSDADAHWEAIRLMSRSAMIQASRWPAGIIISSLADLITSDQPLVIFDAANEIEQDAGHSLPVGWHVTSDSIAAWIALKSRAAELVLLKSVGDDEPFSIEQAVARGWLDAYFPTLAAELEASHIRTTWINVRDASLNPLPLRLCSQAIDKDV